MEIQELVARARILFSGTHARFEVFKLVNGKRSAKEIATKLRRSVANVLHDMQKMRDMELIIPKTDRNGKVLKKSDSIVYEKAPLIRHLPLTYFEEPTRKLQRRKLRQSLL